MSVRILIGDVRERLGELPEESVHCVVTSPLSVVQVLARFIKFVASSEVFIGIGKGPNTPNPAAIALEFSIADDFRSVLLPGGLESPQIKNHLGIAALHPQKRKQLAKQPLRARVRRLKRIKRTATSRPRLLAVTPSIQLRCQQLNRWQVGHPDLDTSLIRRGDAIAPRGRTLDADIALAVNNSSEVGIKNITTGEHHVVTIT